MFETFFLFLLGNKIITYIVVFCIILFLAFYVLSYLGIDTNKFFSMTQDMVKGGLETIVQYIRAMTN